MPSSCPGLRRYLAQSLGFEIERVDAFRGLVGPEVLATPAFKDNLLSFGVCYGLCLQGLGEAGLRTNLLPKEITMDRLIRRKKPWAVAAAALVMLACTISYTFHAMQYGSVKESQWKTLETAAEAVSNKSKAYIADEQASREQFNKVNEHGSHLINNLGDRKRWIEFLKELDTCLPTDNAEMPSSTDSNPDIEAAITARKQLLVTNIDSQQVDDVGKWFSAVNQKHWYQPIADAPGRRRWETQHRRSAAARRRRAATRLRRAAAHRRPAAKALPGEG